MVAETIICTHHFSFTVTMNFQKSDSSEVGDYCSGGFLNTKFTEAVLRETKSNRPRELVGFFHDLVGRVKM